ncbi:MAG: DUF1232 domain-containing protein [Desulfobacterales bacterium]|nr:MAG: DUF1232 domain-containing protein [Desulfobacterales bacterium]
MVKQGTAPGGNAGLSRIVAPLKRWAQRLKIEVYTLYVAYQDHRVPWYAKLFAALVVAYALSPIDLIPDFIPILGYLDDLILLPLGIAIALKMIPPSVRDDCRKAAQRLLNERLPRNRISALIIILIWVFLLGVFLYGWHTCFSRQGA